MVHKQQIWIVLIFYSKTDIQQLMKKIISSAAQEDIKTPEDSSCLELSAINTFSRFHDIHACFYIPEYQP